MGREGSESCDNVDIDLLFNHIVAWDELSTLVAYQEGLKPKISSDVLGFLKVAYQWE